MEKLGFTDKWKLEVRNQWFCLFLRKHKYAVTADRRVVVGSQKNISITPITKTSQEKKTPIPSQTPSQMPQMQMNQNPMNGRQNQKPFDGRGQSFEMKKR